MGESNLPLQRGRSSARGGMYVRGKLKRGEQDVCLRAKQGKVQGHRNWKEGARETEKTRGTLHTNYLSQPSANRAVLEKNPAKSCLSVKKIMLECGGIVGTKEKLFYNLKR